MEFKQKDWIGNWTNFESYIESEEPAMKRCWAEAEEQAKQMPMFQNGVRAFWQKACDTVNEENKVRLKGWKIQPTETGMEIEWLGEKGQSLGRYDYMVSDIIPKGLEGKENFLFEAVQAPDSWPFRFLLAMEPMPKREVRMQGGLLSHLHFQYASRAEMLLKDGTLCRPMWYATMCDGDGMLLEQCNIIRALHRMPVWHQMPED